MTNETTSPQPPAAKPKADRWIKLGFAAVAVGIVGWLILRQYIGSPLAGWDTDLQAGIDRAAAENRLLVAVIYDSPQNLNYKKLRRIVQKPGNVKAMDEAGAIRVHDRLGADDPLCETYGVTSFPTTLLIGPDGGVITRWSGYIGEVDFRAKLLTGQEKNSPLKQAGWSTDLEGTLRQAEREKRKVVAVVYDSVANPAYRRLTQMLTSRGARQAVADAKVLPAHLWLAADDPRTKAYEITEYPAVLLLRPDGTLSVGWSGEISEDDFRRKFLKGRPQP